MNTLRYPSETIAAIATATGRGGVGIVRISGQNLAEFARQLCGNLPSPRMAALTSFRATDQSPIDSGLIFYFPAPHSFTGEDVIELHGHGGPIVLNLLLRRCLDLGARLAEPGEFTRRAYLNGKIDLTQAEAVADLIDAASAAAARSAARSLQGEFSREIDELLDALTRLQALTEATLDFPGEEIDFLESANAFGQLEELQNHLDAVFDRARQGRLLQEGLHVVLRKHILCRRLGLEEQANAPLGFVIYRVTSGNSQQSTFHFCSSLEAHETGITIGRIEMHIRRVRNIDAKLLGKTRYWQYTKSDSTQCYFIGVIHRNVLRFQVKNSLSQGL